MSKKALVIGSRGNIGKPLSLHLKEKGYTVLEVDTKPGWKDGYLMADINNSLDLNDAFAWKPDVVFMLAAMVSRVTCEQAAGLAVDTNLAGLNNVIQLTRKAGAKLIYFSTSEVYGPDIEFMDESLSDPMPNNRYGLTKLLGEKLVEYEVRTYGMEAVTLRPFMMYDENEDLGDHRSAMIRFVSNLARGMEIEVHKGSARGWFHVSDAVEVIERSVGVKEYSVINIGNPDIRSIEDLAEIVRAQLNASPDLITYIDLPERMTLQKRPNLSRQKELLGYEPKVGLEEGVKLVCDNMKHLFV